MLSSTILAKNSANLLSTPVESEIQYASLCIQQGEPQQALARYIVLLLNYQYGLSTIIKTSIDAVSTPEPQYQGTIRCYFVINNRVPSTAILTQFLDKQIPLILLCPEATLVATKPNNSDNLSYCSWDQAFRPQQPVLPQIIATIFAKYQIPKLYEAGFDNPAKINPKHIGHLINNVETLPTLPQIILHIMRLVHDPKSTTEQLEKVVLSDPAIVHKLLQVVNSPTFAGLAHTGQWTLKDALIRLGRRKIGAIAQQVKLINTFAKEQESNFDMHRFWQHSASCAIIVDRIYEKKMVRLRRPVSFNEYWLSALLHDIGKLLLGCFFWSYFAKISDQIQRDKTVLDFCQAETNLGNIADHEFIGRLLLIKANLQRSVIDAVGSHHSGSTSLQPLVCLIHLADNLSKDLGMGYFSMARGNYNPIILQRLGLEEKDLDYLRQQLDTNIQQEVSDLVDLCLA